MVNFDNVFKGSTRKMKENKFLKTAILKEPVLKMYFSGITKPFKKRLDWRIL